MLLRFIHYIKRNFPSNNSPLVRASLFLDRRGPVWSTLQIITNELNKAKIDYAVIGGLDVFEHGYERTTKGCDLLLTKTGLQQFQEQLVGRYVKPKFKGAKKTFICYTTKTPIDIIVQGERPGNGKDVPVEYPDPRTNNQLINGYCIITLAKLIELKLSSFKQWPIRRAQDEADVMELIRIHNLNKSSVEFLHPYVQNEFKELIGILEEEKQREYVEEI